MERLRQTERQTDRQTERRTRPLLDVYVKTAAPNLFNGLISWGSLFQNKERKISEKFRNIEEEWSPISLHIPDSVNIEFKNHHLTRTYKNAYIFFISFVTETIYLSYLQEMLMEHGFTRVRVVPYTWCAESDEPILSQPLTIYCFQFLSHKNVYNSKTND